MYVLLYCLLHVYTHVAIIFFLAATLLQGTKEEFEIPAEVDCRTHCYVNSTFRLLSNDSETLQTSGLFEDQVAEFCWYNYMNYYCCIECYGHCHLGVGKAE